MGVNGDLRSKSKLTSIESTSTKSKLLLKSNLGNEDLVGRKMKLASNVSTKHKQPSVTITPSLFMPGLGTTHKADIEKEHLKPSLFNKELATLKKDSFGVTTIKPSLFSLTKLENSSQLTQQKVPKPKYITTKKESLISKQLNLQKENVRVKIKAPVKAGKSCPSKKTVETKSKKKNDAKLTIVTANVEKLVMVDDDFKNKQMAMIRKRIKMENKELFMDTKMLNQNAMKMKKDNVLKLKVREDQKFLKKSYIMLILQ